MKRKISVSAPGKLILLGEHAVVYGKPAIIAAVNKRCFVDVEPRTDKQIEIVIKNYDRKEVCNTNKILEITNTARKTFTAYKNNNDFKKIKTLTENPLDFAKIIIGETFIFFNKQINSGMTLIIDSEIPLGAGMGSSAAAAVSISGAVSLFLGEKFNRENINKIAYSVEEIKHGHPSGADNSACCYGGLIWFRRETPDLNFIRPLNFEIPRNTESNFYTIFTGIPEESTGEMVNFVKNFYMQNNQYTESVFLEQEMLTRELINALKTGNNELISNIIKRGERNLEKLGVVSPFVKKIIRDTEESGGAAKICGGGGRKKATGVLLVYHPNRQALELMLKSQNLTSSQVVLGVDGIRREK